jgi:hypothetical protein
VKEALMDNESKLLAKDFLKWPAWAVAAYMLDRGWRIPHKLRVELEAEERAEAGRDRRPS